MGIQSKQLKVLIVEDDISFQELYEEILTPKYNVIIVENKEQAQAQVQQQEFDIALVDVRLSPKQRGNQDGLEVVQLMRNLGQKTLVILKSGFPIENPDTGKRIESLGIFKVLDKSADEPVQEMVDTIKKAAMSISPR